MEESLNLLFVNSYIVTINKDNTKKYEIVHINPVLNKKQAESLRQFHLEYFSGLFEQKLKDSSNTTIEVLVENKEAESDFQYHKLENN